MKKKLLILLSYTPFVACASFQSAQNQSQAINYGLTKAAPMFAAWPAKTNGYDTKIKEATYDPTNPPIGRSPSKIWGKNSRPFPTNRWYSTLAISGDIAYTSSNTPAEFTQPFSVITFPYIIQALLNGQNAEQQQTYPGLLISVPEKQYITTACNPSTKQTESTAYTCQNNSCTILPNDPNSPNPSIVQPGKAGEDYPCYSFSSSFLNITPYNIILSCTEQEQLEDPIIDSEVNDNPFGVTLLFKTATDNKNTNTLQRFATPIVRGMPFVTALYNGTTPSLEFPGQAVLRFATVDKNGSISLQPNGLPPTTLTGTSFIIQLNSSQSWFIYTNTPITLNYIKGSNSATTPDQIVASQPFSGLIQVINTKIPQIQPPAIPLPLSPTDNWATQATPNYKTYQEYFDDLFFPAVQTWYQTTYMGTEYSEKMPKFNAPQGQSIYNYYFNPQNPNDPKTYYGQLYNDWQSDKSLKNKSRLDKLIVATLNKLQTYSGTYPTGGTVDLTGTENDCTLTINWSAESVSQQPNLLMMSLPHHQELLPKSTQYEPLAKYDSIRGQLYGVIGSQWKLQYTKPAIGSSTNPWHCNYDANIRKPEFQQILNEYLDQEDISVQATDSYGFGKEAARLARLALIGHQTNYNNIMDILTAIKTALNPWIPQAGAALGKNANPLYYDGQWGGICTQNGLQDHTQDYGMGWYNDHHFHFGYFIYAAAVYLYLAAELQESDSTFDPLLINFTKELIRDIANPHTDDTYFPNFRLMDWYLGHSLAAGIFPFGNGKNQESTSEAVNAWYGISLFGLALEKYSSQTENSNALQNLGNTLMAAEIMSAQTYWYMTADSQIYPPVFNKLACVGVLWETKADYATFFGTNVEFINLIHFLPFTPATEALIPQAWNGYQWELLKSSLTRTIDTATGANDPLEDQWRSYVHMSQAITNPTEAQKAFSSFIDDINTKFQPFDNGNSATNTLYWLLTRPSFNPTGTIPKYVPIQPTPTPSNTPGNTPSNTPSNKPSNTPSSKPSTPTPAIGRLVPGLPASPSIAESMGYENATQSIAAYTDYLKTSYLTGIINWYMQTYPSKFPTNISFAFDGSSPQEVYTNFANSDFYQTLVKHYNKYPKTPYFHIPAGPAPRPPLPGLTSDINQFIAQTFIATWCIPVFGKYNGYTSIQASNMDQYDQYREFLVHIYAPAYSQWIQKLKKAQ